MDEVGGSFRPIYGLIFDLDGYVCEKGEYLVRTRIGCNREILKKWLMYENPFLAKSKIKPYLSN